MFGHSWTEILFGDWALSAQASPWFIGDNFFSFRGGINSKFALTSDQLLNDKTFQKVEKCFLKNFLTNAPCCGVDTGGGEKMVTKIKSLFLTNVMSGFLFLTAFSSVTN